MIGLFAGRFQPFHLGHLRVVKDILKENDKVVIAIGSAQFKNTPRNPFSSREREEMINLALRGEGIDSYKIIKIKDYFNPPMWVAAIKRKCRFDNVYSRNEWTISCFESQGISVKRHKIYRPYSGTLVRRLMVEGKKWNYLVPPQVYLYIKSIRGEERVRKIVEASI